jgi:hypothetical protein
MPKRVFRAFLSNNTDEFLQRKDHGTCHGDWTSSDWEPPEAIGPRSEGGWQTESGGIATGTAGWAIYVIGDLTFGLHICIYWNSPYLGDPFTAGLQTEANSAVGDFDFNADNDCGGKGLRSRANSSDFETIATSSFVNNRSQAVPRPLDGSEGNILYEIPFAPFVIFGTADIIVEHAWARFILRRKGSVRQSFRLADDPSKGLRRFKRSDLDMSVRETFRL